MTMLWKALPFRCNVKKNNCTQQPCDDEYTYKKKLEWEMHKLLINFMTNSLLLSCIFSYASLINSCIHSNKQKKVFEEKKRSIFLQFFILKISLPSLLCISADNIAEKKILHIANNFFPFRKICFCSFDQNFIKIQPSKFVWMFNQNWLDCKKGMKIDVEKTKCFWKKKQLRKNTVDYGLKIVRLHTQIRFFHHDSL